MAFVKTTFALVWATNRIEQSPLFELSHADFAEPSGLLYNDYIRLLYLAKSILNNNGLNHKKKLYKDLKIMAEITGYVLIYDILKDLDPAFKEYFEE